MSYQTVEHQGLKYFSLKIAGNPHSKPVDREWPPSVRCQSYTFPHVRTNQVKNLSSYFEPFKKLRTK